MPTRGNAFPHGELTIEQCKSMWNTRHSHSLRRDRGIKYWLEELIDLIHKKTSPSAPCHITVSNSSLILFPLQYSKRISKTMSNSQSLNSLTKLRLQLPWPNPGPTHLPLSHVYLQQFQRAQERPCWGERNQTHTSNQKLTLKPSPTLNLQLSLTQLASFNISFQSSTLKVPWVSQEFHPKSASPYFKLINRFHGLSELRGKTPYPLAKQRSIQAI